MTNITHSDIAQALQDALRVAQEQNMDTEIDYSLGITLPELVEASGYSNHSLRKMLKQAIKAGIVEFNGRQRRRSMLGEWCRTPVYRVKKGDFNGSDR